MASSVIHMCVAKRINDTLQVKDTNMLLLGSIAPDISKHVQETKTRSHFYDNNNHIDLKKFLNKYQDELAHPFILGYFIHLYTDYLWEKYFLTEIVSNDLIKLLDGTSIKKDKSLYKQLLYSDYTNLDVTLLDEYNLNLSLFYNEAVIPDVDMEEIPVAKLSKLLDYTSIVIENNKKENAHLFDLNNIKVFIETSAQLILSEIKQILD